MATREDGEFELILGNKQLLSVLFIVIVLLGVFFAMGFLAGRTASPTAPAVVAKSDAGPLMVEPGSKQSPAPVGKDLAPPEQVVKPATAPPATKVEPRPASTAPPVAPPMRGGYVETPPKGTYLQVAATTRADAENMLGLLSKQGLRGYATPSTKNPQLIRVIIGPLGDSEAMAATRKKLSDEGVASPVIVKY